MRVIVIGGSGFVGSRLVLHLLRETNYEVANFDTEEFHRGDGVSRNVRYTQFRANAENVASVDAIFDKFRPNLVFHLTSHPAHLGDRGDMVLQRIIRPAYVVGEACRSYLVTHGPTHFRLVRSSATNVYGDQSPYVVTRYNPHSLAAAADASANHVLTALYHAHCVPVILTHASPNYGPGQSTGIIPRTVMQALASHPITTSGGKRAHDWIHVDDHVVGLVAAARLGTPGQSYIFGGNEVWNNTQIVRMICRHLDEVAPRRNGHESLIQTDVEQTSGPSLMVDVRRVQQELMWKSNIRFVQGLKETVSLMVTEKMKEVDIAVATA